MDVIFEWFEKDPKRGGGAALLAILFIAAVNAIVVVPPAYVGVIAVFGNVASRTISQGLHITNPLARVHLFNIKTLLLDPDFQSVPTKEGLTVELDTAILYHIEPQGARDIFLQLGPNFESLIIRPALFSAVRGLTSEYEAKALYTSGRNEIQRALQAELSEKLTPRGIVVEDVLLKAVKLPDQLVKAVETKMQREQESEQMEFVLLKEKQETERKRIEARGIADFQKIVAQGITPSLLKWKGIEATEKLAKSKNSKVVVIGPGGNGMPVILGDDRKGK